MKTYILIGLFLLSYQPLIAQTVQKMRIGVSAGYGRDFYSRQLKGLPNGPNLTEHFESKRSMAVGIYGERFISDRVSLLPGVMYSSQNVPTNTLCQCNHLDYLQKETHHVVSLNAGARMYLLQRSPVKLFAGAGLRGEYFIGYAEKRNDQTKFHWSALSFNRFNPGVSAELGTQWKRLGFGAEYGTHIARTFAKGYRLSTGETVKRSIFRQGVSIKMSFLITNPK